MDGFYNYDDSVQGLINENLHCEINFHNITHDDMLNGTGLRVALWVAGCIHQCPNCQNPITWNENGGMPFTQWEESEFWEWLDKPWTEGATFTGGDPLHPKNREKIGNMMKKIKETRPNKNVWVYTGYDLKCSESEGFYFEDANGNTFIYPYLKYIDTLVDGRFECKIRELDLKTGKDANWRGSSNQRVIDVQRSIKENRIIVMEE